MVSKVIYLDKISDITQFAIEAQKIEGDVIARRGKFVVDAKSILGVISINPAEGMTVEYPEGEENFTHFLDEFGQK